MQKSNVTVTVDFPLSSGLDRGHLTFNIEPVTVVRPIQPPRSEEELKRHPLYNRLMDEINAAMARAFSEHFQMGEYTAPLPVREEKSWRPGE